MRVQEHITTAGTCIQQNKQLPAHSHHHRCWKLLQNDHWYGEGKGGKEAGAAGRTTKEQPDHLSNHLQLED